MDKQWMEETCGSCAFRIHGRCRRHPPIKVVRVASNAEKSETFESGEYTSVHDELCACYDWRRNY